MGPLRLWYRVVMVGLVPTIHLSASSAACGTLGPRDKPEDDTGWRKNTKSDPLGLGGGGEGGIDQNGLVVFLQLSEPP
jgi:hypothetical protein